MYAAKPTERPTGGKFLGYDHLHFWVGNALQSAAFYCCRFGFDYYAYKYWIDRFKLLKGSRDRLQRCCYSCDQEQTRSIVRIL